MSRDQRKLWKGIVCLLPLLAVILLVGFYIQGGWALGVAVGIIVVFFATAAGVVHLFDYFQGK